jgi:hypothetical protein
MTYGIINIEILICSVELIKAEKGNFAWFGTSWALEANLKFASNPLVYTKQFLDADLYCIQKMLEN